MIWNNKKVLVTGGASFVGSHLCQQLLGWSPQTKFADGLQKTTDWYINSKTTKQASADLTR